MNDSEVYAQINQVRANKYWEEMPPLGDGPQLFKERSCGGAIATSITSF